MIGGSKTLGWNVPQSCALLCNAAQCPYNSGMAKSWKTRLIHSEVKVPEGYRSLASPVFRGSTTLFPDAASVNDSWDQPEVGYTYGLYGTPTTLELAGKICELEKGYRTIITPGGQGAISLISLAFLKSGDHILIPESVYTSSRKLAYHVLRRFGVEAGFYPPEVGARMKDLLRIPGWCGARARDRSPWKCRMCLRLPRPCIPVERSSRWITPGLRECTSMRSRTVWTSRCRRRRNM